MSKKQTNKKKLFGRNVFTLVFIVIILLIGVIITNNIITSVKNNVTPFVTKNDLTEYEEGAYDASAKRMKGSDFDAFGLEIECTSYNEDTDTAVYKIYTYKNENIKDISSCSAQLCLASDNIGFIQYSSKVSSIKFADDKDKATSTSTYSKTFTVNNVIDYPAKTSHWPIPFTVKTPKIYLYISYQYTVNAGAAKTESFILEYDYKDILPLQGGIAK